MEIDPDNDNDGCLDGVEDADGDERRGFRRNLELRRERFLLAALKPAASTRCALQVFGSPFIETIDPSRGGRSSVSPLDEPQGPLSKLTSKKKLSGLSPVRYPGSLNDMSLSIFYLTNRIYFLVAATVTHSPVSSFWTSLAFLKDPFWKIEKNVAAGIVDDRKLRIISIDFHGFQTGTRSDSS